LFFVIPSTLMLSLFPYTTLFRSPCELKEPGHAFFFDQGHAHGLIRLPNWGVELQGNALRPIEGGGADTLLNRVCIRRGKADLPPDRKSTRLNSRHVKISYAVFCL